MRQVGDVIKRSAASAPPGVGCVNCRKGAQRQGWVVHLQAIRHADCTGTFSLCNFPKFVAFVTGSSFGTVVSEAHTAEAVYQGAAAAQSRRKVVIVDTGPNRTHHLKMMGHEQPEHHPSRPLLQASCNHQHRPTTGLARRRELLTGDPKQIKRTYGHNNGVRNLVQAVLLTLRSE